MDRVPRVMYYILVAYNDLFLALVAEAEVHQ